MEIIAEEDFNSRLKLQLMHMIKAFEPTWSSLFHKGRREAMRYFPPDVLQCFEEASLIDGYEPDVITWWDDLSSISRKSIDDSKLLVGREGEKLSIQYERDRTGYNPEWVSIESNLLGFDILSRTDSTGDTSLKIEVKASKSLSQEFTFYLTQREWDIAQSSLNYIFHLWILGDDPELYVYSLEELKKHIPIDKGEGSWETVKICIKKNDLKNRCV
ncbi:MAG TPA: DUF3883 domain-containing protein [Bacillales bacterium]|nr:DUF3883 domain-containing protein [Bacillales bacterium]